MNAAHNPTKFTLMYFVKGLSPTAVYRSLQRRRLGDVFTAEDAEVRRASICFSAVWTFMAASTIASLLSLIFILRVPLRPLRSATPMTAPHRPREKNHGTSCAIVYGCQKPPPIRAPPNSPRSSATSAVSNSHDPGAPPRARKKSTEHRARLSTDARNRAKFVRR